jgi:lipopolysaccharide biosynthesis glycosyltransferase
LASWCFIQTQSLAPKILWIDQSIINIALQNFKFKASTLPRTYNVHPLLSPVRTGDAYILHTMGVNKFWNNLPSFAWRRYYKQWLAAGGTPMQPQNKRLTVRMLYLLKLTVENIPWLWDVIKVMIRNRFKK